MKARLFCENPTCSNCSLHTLIAFKPTWHGRNLAIGHVRDGFDPKGYPSGT